MSGEVHRGFGGGGGLRFRGEMAARALLWSGFPAACIRQGAWSRCVGSSSPKLFGRQAPLSELRGSPASTRRLHFDVWVSSCNSFFRIGSRSP